MGLVRDIIRNRILNIAPNISQFVLNYTIDSIISDLNEIGYNFAGNLSESSRVDAFEAL